MARKPFHQQLQENLQALKDGKEPPHERAAEEARAKFEEMEKSEAQHRIMSPEGTNVKLSYGEVTFYPFTIREKRRAGGFISRVAADAMGVGARSVSELEVRVGSLLLSRDDLENELFRLAAIARFKPGELVDSTDATLPHVAEFQQKCVASDVIELFSVISDLADFKAPKL